MAVLCKHRYHQAVSTHSRPKAAGASPLRVVISTSRFNSQPPEGGWPVWLELGSDFDVSTHSRPKAAGITIIFSGILFNVSTHSRPKAAGKFEQRYIVQDLVSTHSRPKAAGMAYAITLHLYSRFQLTAARRRLAPNNPTQGTNNMFQLTAARRRLD